MVKPLSIGTVPIVAGSVAKALDAIVTAVSASDSEGTL